MHVSYVCGNHISFRRCKMHGAQSQPAFPPITAPRGIQQGESRHPQRPINHAGTSTGHSTASSTARHKTSGKDYRGGVAYNTELLGAPIGHVCFESELRAKAATKIIGKIDTVTYANGPLCPHSAHAAMHYSSQETWELPDATHAHARISRGGQRRPTPGDTQRQHAT